MLSSLKNKIIFISILILVFVGGSDLLLSYNAYVRDKTDRIETARVAIAYFGEKVNKNLSQLVSTARNLAVAGSVFYNSNERTRRSMYTSTIKTFEIDDVGVGGGIWFEPYKIDNKKYFCSYAYDRNNGVIIDPSFENDSYDYHNQSWYTFIKNEINNNDGDFSFTKPYLDPIGTHSLMITFGAAIYDNQNKFVGMTTVDWELDKIISDVSKLKPTPNSFALFADKKNDFIIVLTNDLKTNDSLGKSLNTIPWYSKDLVIGSKFTYNDVTYLSFPVELQNNMLLIVNVPENELYADLNKRFKMVTFVIVISVILLALIMYFVLVNNVNKPVEYLVKMANKIGSGDLNSKMEITSPTEFALLASSFNKMTTDIQDYITNLNKAKSEKKLLEEELQIAQEIQSSSLPKVFPPYPDRAELDILASMTPAKEVGGDFYDFFFIDEHTFSFLIADVSGKGVPAALFMMRAKTLIKNFAQTKLPPADVLNIVNKELCKDNDKSYFVTLYYAQIDLLTGNVQFVNAGHTPPLIKRTDGQFEYYKSNPNFVLGAWDAIEYKSYSFDLNKGDYFFLYTDGVTEAQTAQEAFFGEERLKNILNANEISSVDDILNNVNAGLSEFTAGAEQYDDITMLAFKYNGPVIKPVCTEVAEFPAKYEEFVNILSWLEPICDECGMDMKNKAKFNVALEEIFINIVNYAYPDTDGSVEITAKSNLDYIELTFKDSGIPYNPLEQEEPDTSLGVDERQVGGLGIFIVKNTMDVMDYKFENGYNILTIRKNM